MIDFNSLRRLVRLIVLLDGVEESGMSPIALERLHTYAYLSNVLAPVWDLDAFDGSILKSEHGPYYPVLQEDLDRMVGSGLAMISQLSYTPGADGHWKLNGFYSLNYQMSGEVIALMDRFEDERRVRIFLKEVAFAFSALDDREMAALPNEDPTYSDKAIGYGDIVDFAEWRARNYTANVAMHFGTVAGNVTKAELLHLYTRHVHRRVSERA